MPITFRNYLNGDHPNIKHCDGLVLGWMVQDRASDLEYLYALDKGGQAYRCEAKLGSDDFDTRRRTWWPVNTVPNGAEYIGHYPPPRTIAKI
jgi:hypothetical protein